MMISNKVSFRATLALLLVSLSWLPLELRAATIQSRTSRLIARAEQVTGDKFTLTTSTRKGVTVIAVRSPSPEVLATIDQGFEELFAVARRHGYQSHLNFSDYTVFIGRSDRTTD